METTANLGLQQQEFKQPKTFEEDRFLGSLKDTKVRSATLEELKQPLRYAMVKVGLRAQNFPTDEEKGILLAHVMQEYGSNTLEEIKLAFDLLIGEKLDLEPKDKICYENFSCAYFSTVMNSYRRWATEVYQQHTPNYNPLQIEHKEDTSDAAMQDWLDHIRSQPIIFDFLPVMLYEWLERKGVIKKTNEEKREYLKQAVFYRQSQLQKSFAEDSRMLGTLQAFNDMKDKGEFTGDEIPRLKGIAKRLILKEYIDGLSV